MSLNLKKDRLLRYKKFSMKTVNLLSSIINYDNLYHKLHKLYYNLYHKLSCIINYDNMCAFWMRRGTIEPTPSREKRNFHFTRLLILTVVDLTSSLSFFFFQKSVKTKKVFHEKLEPSVVSTGSITLVWRTWTNISLHPSSHSRPTGVTPSVLSLTITRSTSSLLYYFPGTTGSFPGV